MSTLTSPSMAQPGPVDAARTVEPPANVAPADPGAGVAPAADRSPYTLPRSPTRDHKDLCGNAIGTVYVENSPCSELEAISGPYITYKTPWEKWLNVMALVMALAFSALYIALHWLTRDTKDEGPARGLIIIFVIGSAVFVLTAGFDDKQAAPLYGLLGTLIGYLFGRSTSEKSPEPAGATPPATPVPAGATPSATPVPPGATPPATSKPPGDAPAATQESAGGAPTEKKDESTGS